jgi:hypothetical protein
MASCQASFADKARWTARAAASTVLAIRRADPPDAWTALRPAAGLTQGLGTVKSGTMPEAAMKGAVSRPANSP